MKRYSKSVLHYIRWRKAWYVYQNGSMWRGCPKPVAPVFGVSSQFFMCLDIIGLWKGREDRQTLAASSRTGKGWRRGPRHVSSSVHFNNAGYFSMYVENHNIFPLRFCCTQFYNHINTVCHIFYEFGPPVCNCVISTFTSLSSIHCWDVKDLTFPIVLLAPRNKFLQYYMLYEKSSWQTEYLRRPRGSHSLLLQSTLSKVDTLGTKATVRFREVSALERVQLQRYKCNSAGSGPNLLSGLESVRLERVDCTHTLCRNAPGIWFGVVSSQGHA